jgi:dipeptidyl aminopeptidase/acylaminoacyl peptidase
LGLLLAAVMALGSSAVRAAPLDLYGKLPNLGAVAVSPDGDQVAMIGTDGEASKIIIWDVTKKSVVNVLAAGKTKVRALRWAGPGHLIVTTSQTAVIADVIAPRDEYVLCLDYNLATHRFWPLLNDVSDGLNIVVHDPAVRVVQGKPALFVQGVQFVGGRGAVTLFRIDLNGDSSKPVRVGELNTREWLVGQDGEPLAEVIYDDKSGRWSLKVHGAAGWKESRVVTMADSYPAMAGLGRDGHSVLMRQLKDGEDVLQEVGPDGTWGDPLPTRGADVLIFDPASHGLIGYHTLVGEEDRFVFFDPKDQKAWDAVVKAYPDQRVSPVSWSDNRRKIVVLADSPSEGPAYALVDLDAGHGTWLGGRYDKLTPEDIASVTPLRFKAKDGLELTGYLTLPRGKAAKDLPLVVVPHDGPTSRNRPGFDWWTQALASRGYAVLQVNFRGSDGYGWDFLKAGFGQWGRKMQTDLSDGVRYVAGEGTIDPKRVCIVGATYGGYAALAGVTLDPGVYRCAVSYAGISDLKRFGPWLRANKSLSSERYFDRFIGAESARDPSMLEVSPVAHVDKVTAPILLIHGKDDTVVPIAQSQVMADALKAAGKPVELVTLNSTDHWLTKGETRLQMLQATVAFLEKNNPPN